MNARSSAAESTASHPAAAVHRGMYGHLVAIFEGVVLLLGLVALERVFLGQGALGALSVHPFWLPVVLVSLQHGLYAGVATACLAGLMADWPIRAAGQDVLDHYFQIIRLPLQWMLAALAIGVFRQAQIHENRLRELAMVRLQAMNDRLAAEIDRLDAAIGAYELAAAVGADNPAAGSARGAPVHGAATDSAAAAGIAETRPLVQDTSVAALAGPDRRLPVAAADPDRRIGAPPETRDTREPRPAASAGAAGSARVIAFADTGRLRLVGIGSSADAEGATPFRLAERPTCARADTDAGRRPSGE